MLKESITFASGKAINELAKEKPASLQTHNLEHANTGIDVTTRFQYTPLQLVNMLNDRGFNTVDIYPIHIHCLPSKIKDEHPEIHASFSNLLQAYAHDYKELLPFASSFMLHLQKVE